MGNAHGQRIPGYLRHKASGLGYSRFGRNSPPLYYPGPYGSDESRTAYAQAIAEWKAGSRSGVVSPNEQLTVRQVLAAWVIEADQRYRKYGRRTSEWYCHVSAIRPVRKLYSDLLASEFGPRQLMGVRQQMLDCGWHRSTINKHCVRIRSIWRWAECQGFVPAGAAATLATLQGLRAGRTEAKESMPKKPVTWKQLLAVLRRCSPECGALVRLQWLTGMRPVEACEMRWSDIEEFGDLWQYRVSPERAKTAKEEYWLGQRARKIIGGCTSKWREGRMFGLNLAQYRFQIRDCCRLAGVPIWTPHQLRHTHASNTANRYGLEAAAQRLNHSDTRTTRIYTGTARELAKRIARERG